jgi:Na+-driven multidrug efflux pump
MTTALSSRWSHLSLIRSEFRIAPATAARILRIGGPAGLEGAVTFTGHFLFLMIIARLSPGGFDGAAFAAHIVGVRVESLSYLPALAWGIACSSLVGQSLGARQPERAQLVGRVAIRQIVAYAFVVGLIFGLGAPQIYAAMHSDPNVAVQGVPAFRLMASYQVPTVILIVLACCLRGAGDTRFPLLCVLIGTIGLRVPLGYLFGVVLQWGLLGAWIGMGVDNIVRAGLLWWRYRSGRWVRTSV